MKPAPACSTFLARAGRTVPAFRRFARAKCGSAPVEHALLIAFIALAFIITLDSFGVTLQGIFREIRSRVA